MRKSVDVLVIALSSPILIGVYEENKLLETIKSDEKSSEYLPLVFKDLLERFTIQSLFYANGPGSFMAIKVAYVFLQSLCVLKNIKLFAADAFKFNQNRPIKAIGKLCFVKIDSEIKTQKLEVVPEPNFRLPELLDYDEFTTEASPLYIIGAVG